MICDICGECEATLFDRVVENGKSVEYAYCKACYSSALKHGQSPKDVARACIARKGKECRACGHTAEQLEKTLYLGCPDCYREMRGVVEGVVCGAQAENSFSVNKLFDNDVLHISTPAFGENGSDESALDCVVSSRVRLARNVEGVRFPHCISSADERTVEIIKGAMRAADGLFDARLLTMSSLTKSEKVALVERHLISLPLANNSVHGAVIIEKGNSSQMSVMINEEDHLREQCMLYGHNLSRAYERLHTYDMRLKEQLPLAYDRQFGYLTACVTNVGTGMRASEMLFLPALERTENVERLFGLLKKSYGVTARGYFGEGSDAAYGMYQISNSRTFGVSAAETVGLIERVVEKVCCLERRALDILVQGHKTQLLKGVHDSYGRLAYAYSLTMPELMEKLADVRLGVMLGELPISMATINEIIERCALSSEVTVDGISADERNIARANIVRDLLTEEK